jgi:hypothetical protein
VRVIACAGCVRRSLALRQPGIGCMPCGQAHCTRATRQRQQQRPRAPHAQARWTSSRPPSRPCSPPCWRCPGTRRRAASLRAPTPAPSTQRCWRQVREAAAPCVRLSCVCACGCVKRVCSARGTLMCDSANSAGASACQAGCARQLTAAGCPARATRAHHTCPWPASTPPPPHTHTRATATATATATTPPPPPTRLRAHRGGHPARRAAHLPRAPALPQRRGAGPPAARAQGLFRCRPRGARAGGCARRACVLGVCAACLCAAPCAACLCAGGARAAPSHAGGCPSN